MEPKGLLGILYDQQKEGGGLFGLPTPAPQPTGLLGALYANPMIQRQVAAQRAANPRPDVTDLFGYGPSWASYAQNTAKNLQEQFPAPGATDAGSLSKLTGLLGFAPVGMTKMTGVAKNAAKFNPVVDDAGKPQVFYHGTKADFSDFRAGGGEYGKGIYFSPDPNTAHMYAARAEGAGGENIRPVYLDMKNPYVAKTRDEVRALGPTKLKQMGHDGIIGIGPNGEKQYVVFDQSQIKSVLGE